MLSAVSLNGESSVFEIGCGDGFLTKSILQQPFARFWVFEIDHQWAEYVKITYPDARMTVYSELPTSCEMANSVPISADTGNSS